jgi:hypothetical protein
VVVGSSVILFDPIFQGLAIALMAGEIASLALSRMTVPVVYFIFNQRRSSRELEQSVVGGGRLYQDCRLQAGAWRSSR